MTTNTHSDSTSAPDTPDGVVAPLPKPTRKRRMAREPGETRAAATVASNATAEIEIDAAPSAFLPIPPTPAPSKNNTVLTLLRSDDGATLNEMITATGWLPHTTRAVLTSLRKKGHVIERGKREGVTTWRITGEA